MFSLQRIVVGAVVAHGVLLSGLPAAQAQGMRPPHVYHPGIYQNNRMLMNHRAAARAVIKKRHQKVKTRQRVPAHRKTR